MTPQNTPNKLRLQPPGPRSSCMPPALNLIDHSIYLQKGTTSALEYRTKQLQSSKIGPAPDLLKRLEDLTREMGYLRYEIHFDRKTFEILQRLRETSYDVYQQLLLATYIPPSEGRLKELMVQLQNGLQDSMQRQVKAEKQWKAFWGVEFDTEEMKGELI